jgi:hypothetical protein
VIKEEGVVSKVGELMETLDHVKRYNALAKSLRKFALTVGLSMAVSMILAILTDLPDLRITPGKITFFGATLLVLLIPAVGITAGVLYVRRSIERTETGQWKEELSHGFPSALKILSELDWDKTLDEIAIGKLGLILYGILKVAAYWFILSFGLDLLWNAITIYLFQIPMPFFGFVWDPFALLIVLFLVSKDLVRRYKEIHALDMLLMELRWFSLEFKGAEFQA